jgi:hypothetical protein
LVVLARKWIYASLVASLSPGKNPFRWAWSRTLQYLGTFPLVVFAPGVLIVLFGALAVPSRQATAIQRLLMGLLAFAVAVAAAFAISYMFALSIAVYQRYMLRHDPAYASARVAAMHPEPTGSAHWEWLRKVAVELKKSLDNDKPPRYGTGIEDTRRWRDSFREHFPELWLLLDILANERTVIVALTDRLIREAAVAHLDQPPWLPADFIPGIVSMAERKCMTGFPANEPTFDWHESTGSVYWGEFSLGLRVFSSVGLHEGLIRYKGEFEDFVRNARSWPEIANIRMSSDVQQTIKDAVTRQLETIALSDNFTSRCRYCD